MNTATGASWLPIPNLELSYVPFDLKGGYILPIDAISRVEKPLPMINGQKRGIYDIRNLRLRKTPEGIVNTIDADTPPVHNSSVI